MYSEMCWTGPMSCAIFTILVLLTTVVSLDQDAGEPTDRQPYFRDTNTNVTIGPGERAILKCRVDQLGTKTVTWRREGEEHPLTIGLYTFVTDTRITVDYNQRTSEWSLFIQDVRPSDEGIYHCQITTKHQPQNSYDIRLNVETVQVSGVAYVERGNMIKLTCNATGKPDPPHNVDWYKEGRKVESDGRNGIIITKKIEAKVLVSMLVIKYSDMDDEGTYECLSSNKDAGRIDVIILDVNPETKHRNDHIRGPGESTPWVADSRQDHRSNVGEVKSSAVCLIVHSFAITVIVPLQVLYLVLS